MPPPEIPAPWREFLQDLDQSIRTPTELHCLGGFVVAMQYGMPRPTADIDLLAASPESARDVLLSSGGRGSALHRRHGVYIELVILTVEPDGYERRLTEMFQGALRNLRLLALDPYDLALTKLDRNSPKDRADFRHLARSVPFDIRKLRSRFEDALKPYLWDKTEEKLKATLEFWIADFEEKSSSP